MAKGFKHGGGGPGFNFRVLGGTAAPSSPKENDIWVNTDVKVDGWHFGADEPNVRDVKPIAANDPHQLIAPYKLSEGDLLSFVIPATVTEIFEAIRIYDPNTNKAYCVRSWAGASAEAWPVGMKVSLRISNDLWPINGWGKDGTAYITGWGSFYHEAGEVWITTGASSSVPFNALKKNSIMAYPLSASQYIDGAWVKKSASMYKNGGWTVFSVVELYLYDAGDACTADSGGWSITSNTGQQAMKLSEGSSYMTVSSSWSKNYTSHATCGTGKKVNVTNFSKLNVLYDFSASVTTMDGAGDAYAYLTFGLGTSNTSVGSASVSGSQGTNKTVSLDISSLKTSLYVVAKLETYGKNGNINLNIRKVWLS